MVVAATREREIAEVALRLAGLAGRRRARVFALSWWSDHMLARAMKDPAFRAHLFRFVDVYPALSGPGDVSAHLRSEFAEVEVPWWLRIGLGLADVPGGRRISAEVARRSIDRMARQFVIGSGPQEVAEAVGRMWSGGAAATVDLLGEHTHSDAEAARYAARLGALVEALGASAQRWPARPLLDGDGSGPVPRASVSIKVTALSAAFAPLTSKEGLDHAERLLLPILERATELGVWVWFDVERYDVKDLTHRLFRRLLELPELQGLHAGIVVQSYLTDAARDLASLASWGEGRRIKPGVRLVKGAYWDSETVEAAALGWQAPVHLQKFETDVSYEELAQMLHGHRRVLRAAFASHNLRSLAAVIADGRRAGVPDTGYELQLLYGMAEPVHDAVRAAGLRLRVYAPMGELLPGMAYLVRRLLENTSNDSFVRHAFAEGRSIDSLVSAPAPASASGPARSSVERRRSNRSRDMVLSPEGYRPEPLLQWHRGDVVTAFEGALDREFARPERTVEAVIGGRLVPSTRHLASVDPAEPTSVVAVAACCDAAQVESAVSLAHRASQQWRRTAVRGRVEVLLAAAAAMRAQRLDLAALIVREIGKGWADADAEVCEAIDYCEYYARRMLLLGAGGEVQSPPGEENRLRYLGRGVCAVVAPWNFPLAIATGMTAAALVTGNSVVLKPAEQSPAVAAALTSVWAEAGLPDNVMSLVPGLGEEAGAALVGHPAVDLIVFTGSRDVGLGIVERAAVRSDRRASVARVIAEMGGKNALVVDEDADLDEVVPAVIRSSFGFAGQKCSAASRIVAVGRVYGPLVERVVEAARALKVAPARDPGSQVGPVIDLDALQRLQSQISRLGEVGEVLLRRDDVPERGYFVGPAVVGDVEPDSWLATTELFGPVLAAFRAPDFASALQVANSGSYALTAGVFSRSASNVRLALDELRAGNVYANRAITGAVVGRQPFGGNGLSGVGSKAGGPDYLLQFCDPKVTSENTVRQGFAEPRSDA